MTALAKAIKMTGLLPVSEFMTFPTSSSESFVFGEVLGEQAVQEHIAATDAL